MKKKIYPLLSFLVIFSLLAVALQFSLTPASTPHFSSPRKIRVMTFNVHQWYVEDDENSIQKSGRYVFTALLEAIQREDPDIIGLQESEGERISSANQNGVIWLAKQLGMYYFYGPQTSDQIYGVSILSKWPILSGEVIHLPNEESIDRVLIKTLIDHPQGSFYVFNTHFQPGRYVTDRTNQAKVVVEEIKGLKAILTGDFNTRPFDSEEPYQILSQELIDTWVAAGNGVNDTAGLTSPASDPTSRIDYIWVTQSGWQVVPGSGYTTGTIETSDHLAYIVDLVITN